MGSSVDHSQLQSQSRMVWSPGTELDAVESLQHELAALATVAVVRGDARFVVKGTDGTTQVLVDVVGCGQRALGGVAHGATTLRRDSMRARWARMR